MSEPRLIAPDATLRQAAARLGDGGLVCVDRGRPLGLVTDACLRRAMAAGAGLDQPVRAWLDPVEAWPLHALPPPAAWERMAAQPALPVVDAEGRLVTLWPGPGPFTDADFTGRQVTVVGLGSVGLTLAVALADAGLDVAGYDIDAELVRRLGAGQAPYLEAGLEPRLTARLADRLRFADTLPDTLDIVLVAVGTPVADGRPNLASVRSACEAIGPRLGADAAVVMRSTLPVGTTRQLVAPLLAAGAGHPAGDGFRLAFAPERTTSGNALAELARNPQIVGGIDTASADIAADLFGLLTPWRCDVGGLEAAELAKLIDNSHRDHGFAYVNQLLPLADRHGIDLVRLVEAVNARYPRNRVPRPSPGVGGPCLTKDPLILAGSLRTAGADDGLILQARATSEAAESYVLARVDELLRAQGKTLDGAVVGLAGLAFKGRPETAELRGSTGLDIAGRLRARCRLRAFDAAVPATALAAHGLDAVDPDALFDDADAVLLLNDHPTYATWNLQALMARMHAPAVLFDAWGTVNPSPLPPGIRFAALGRPPRG